MTASTDPFFYQLSREWLVQYVEMTRRAPDLVERLRHLPDEFELVPVPRALLLELAAEAADGTVTSWLDDPRLLAGAAHAAPDAVPVELGTKPGTHS